MKKSKPNPFGASGKATGKPEKNTPIISKKSMKGMPKNMKGKDAC